MTAGRLVCVIAFLSLAAFARAAEPWRDALWRNRGGWWGERVSFSVSEGLEPPTNRTSASYAIPVGTGDGRLPFAGRDLADLRLCDGRGGQLVYGIWDRDGRQVTEGAVPEGATVVVPSYAPTNAACAYTFYFGNPRAWKLMDFWPVAPTGAVSGATVKIAAVERIGLSVRDGGEEWVKAPEGTRWLWRLPVRVVNAGKSDRGEAIVAIPVREAARAAANPIVEVWAGGARRWHHRVGKKLYFRCPLPAMSAVTAYVYVREAKIGEKSILSFRASKHGLASEIPSDNVVKEETAADEAVLAKERGFRVTGRPFDPECPPDGGSGFAVRHVSVTRKVFPETPVENAAGPFRFALARNETEELQLAVRSSAAITSLEVRVTPLVSASGARLGLSVGHVECVPLDAATAYYSSSAFDWELRHPESEQFSEGWAGSWPDPIVPGNACALTARTSKAFRFKVKTDGTTAPGIYRGSIAWIADGREIRRDDVVLKVWDFALPEHAELPAIYDFTGSDKRWWKPGEKTNSGSLERMWAFMAENRLCPNGISSRIWLGRDKKDGHVKASFREWDRLADLYFRKYGFPRSYMPSEFWIFGWTHPPRPFLGEAPYEGKWPYDDVDRGKLRPAYKAVYQEALRLFLKHVEEKGLKDRFELYISDEPYVLNPKIVPQMKALCEMVHEVDPTVRIYASTWKYQPKWNDSLDIWGGGHFGNFKREAIGERIAAGKTIWFTTDGQFVIDSIQATAERMLPHYCDAFGVKAYEFWGIAWYTYDPWTCASHWYMRQCGILGRRNKWVRYPNADGYLVYPPKPGMPDRPIPSVRLECAREGVEDYSYLKRLEALAAAKDDPRADEAAAVLRDYRALCRIPNPGGRYMSQILPDPEVLDRLRFRAGELLSKRVERENR